MSMPNSVTERPDPTSVKAIREVNRADLARATAIANVVERLEVYAALTTFHVVLHPNVIKQHATNIVDAVLGLTKGQVNQ